MRRIYNDTKGFSAVEALIIILVLAVLGGIGYMVYHNQHKTNLPSTTNSQSTPASSKITYTSATENASFTYPSDWTVTNKKAAKIINKDDGEVDGDSLTLVSPSGKLGVFWDSFVEGIGGTCDDTLTVVQGGCPEFTYVSATPLSTDSSLSVVTGWSYSSAADGSSNFSYHPFLAIRNSSDDISGVQRTFYMLFKGKNAKKSLLGTSGPSTAVLSIGGIEPIDGDQAALPSFQTVPAVKAYLNNPEYLAAKDILLSYHY